MICTLGLSHTLWSHKILDDDDDNNNNKKKSSNTVATPIVVGELSLERR
jgi:hypothetical protein